MTTYFNIYLVPVTSFDIKITTNPNQPEQLVIGDDLHFTCQIPDDSQYVNPLWYTPNNQRIFPIGEGKAIGFFHFY